jgi:hypothetical protein
MPDFEAWLTEQHEAVQTMLEAHVSGLKSALEKERTARKDFERELRDAGLLEAVWTTAFINDLPDSSFAIVLPGGEKDEDGKTTPRSLRKLPYKGADGEVDVAHLRNALARLSQTDGLTDEQRTEVGRQLKAAAREHLPDYQEESMEIVGEFHPLVEKAVHSDNTVPVKVIGPGWGSSGYYSPEVLERDGPKVFGPGTKMYWDHPTQSEAAERPERSLRDLAGELVDGASYQAEGPAGPGLYAKAKVFEPFRAAVDELAPHIGVSIRARGTVEAGEAEGKSGHLVTSITDAQSVDFVTVPGAGGKVLELFEAARQKPAESEPKVDPVAEAVAQSEAQVKELQKSNQDLMAALREVKIQLVQAQAAGIVARDLEEAGKELPTAARARLENNLLANVPVTDNGELDSEKLSAAVAEAVKAEIAYLAEAVGSGRIRGMGSETRPDGKAALKASFVDLYRLQGKSQEEAERLAEAASQGR